MGYLHREELYECPADVKPQAFAKQYVREEFYDYRRPVLIRVNKEQPKDRMHTRFVTRQYYYLFYYGSCLLPNYPGMEDLWRADSWHTLIWRTKFKRDLPKRRLQIIRAQQLIGNGDDTHEEVSI